jgi:hypothetical protein
MLRNEALVLAGIADGSPGAQHVARVLGGGGLLEVSVVTDAIISG